MRRLHVLCLKTALAAAGLIVPVGWFVPVANAESVAPVTNYEVLLRMLGESFPETATKIREKFDKIDKSDRTRAQKDEAKAAELTKQIDKLNNTGVAASKEGQEAIQAANLLSR